MHMDDFSNMMALLYGNMERKMKGGNTKIKEEIIMPLRQGQKHSISPRGAEREAGFSRAWRKKHGLANTLIFNFWLLVL